MPGDLGFALQNRGNLFAARSQASQLSPAAPRLFHTIIPAMVTRNDVPYFAFGVMGGDMQPQGQVEVLVNLLDFGMNVQQAGAAGRMEHLGSATPTGRAANGVGNVTAERAIPEKVINELRRRGHTIDYGPPNSGGYQGILLDPRRRQASGRIRTPP